MRCLECMPRIFSPKTPHKRVLRPCSTPASSGTATPRSSLSTEASWAEVVATPRAESRLSAPQEVLETSLATPRSPLTTPRSPVLTSTRGTPDGAVRLHSSPDALSLPAGKFVRPFVDHIGEADAFQQAKRFIDIGLRELAQKAAPKPDIAEPPGEHVLHYGQALDQGIFLKNHAHLTARPAKSPSSERG